eukprot:TRINITY_DN473_c0_g2_i1.p1 TRINITY_DN473_c0_g2~~TRINITY_DN473_c0_g2_i1.p1  ORF type:complete len:236 (-),score=89.82 TRINITY_DN473_c0_g2_i1:56-763(-)
MSIFTRTTRLNLFCTMGVGLGGLGFYQTMASNNSMDEYVALAKKKDEFSDTLIVSVLGGPGSGKGTQSAQLVKKFGFVHLSAGDLLRAERKSGSKNGTLIQTYIDEGKIVPAQITIDLLVQAMRDSQNRRVLIDGFPRSMDNATMFEDQVGNFDVILFFECSEEVMEKRLLSRGKSSGRSDDNLATIKKRFRTFLETSMPVVEMYEDRGIVRRINAEQSVEDVTKDVTKIVEEYL